jgi:hypothetical protein
VEAVVDWVQSATGLELDAAGVVHYVDRIAPK